MNYMLTSAPVVRPRSKSVASQFTRIFAATRSEGLLKPNPLHSSLMCGTMVRLANQVNLNEVRTKQDVLTFNCLEEGSVTLIQYGDLIHLKHRYPRWSYQNHTVLQQKCCMATASGAELLHRPHSRSAAGNIKFSQRIYKFGPVADLA